MHWARVDLTAPGIELYVTPTDQTLDGSGYQYRLKRVGTVAQREGLAVAVNGSLFAKEPALIPGYRSGQRAKGVETVVADGRVSHVWEHTYLLWFDTDLVPTLERRKPPPPTALARANGGLGGRVSDWQTGASRTALNRTPDARTAIGVDPGRRLLFLAVFESASPRRAMEELALLGCPRRNAPRRWRFDRDGHWGGRDRGPSGHGIGWVAPGRDALRRPGRTRSGAAGSELTASNRQRDRRKFSAPVGEATLVRKPPSRACRSAAVAFGLSLSFEYTTARWKYAAGDPPSAVAASKSFFASARLPAVV